MKKIFILIILSLLSPASFAVIGGNTRPGPGEGKIIECYRHGDYKGGVLAFASEVTDSAGMQEVCWNKYKSNPVTMSEMRANHPGLVFPPSTTNVEFDLDPHCYSGHSLIGPGEGGRL